MMPGMMLRNFRPILAVPSLALLGSIVARPADAHATSARGTCGAWTIVASPKSSTPTSYLYGISGTSASDVWAVGYHANATDEDWRTMIRHWNGTAWSAVASPNGPHGGFLYAVAALSPRNAWAVGEGPLIEHWNGIRWSVVASPQVTNDQRDPARLTGIAAISPTNIWAVGNSFRAGNLTLIEHWNGQKWSVVPGPGSGALQLTSIAALPAGAMWAVGVRGRALDRAASEHWNGSRWARTTAPGGGLSAVTALSPSDIWAAGGNTIEHWNGATWNLVAGPSPGTQFSGLTGIAALSSTDVWAVGLAGNLVPHDGYAEHPLIEHWNGAAWSIVSSPDTGSPDSQLLGVTAIAPRTIWAVGFAGKHRGYATHALIERYVTCG